MPVHAFAITRSCWPPNRAAQAACCCDRKQSSKWKARKNPRWSRSCWLCTSRAAEACDARAARESAPPCRCDRSASRCGSVGTQDLLPAHFGAIAAAFLDQLQARGIDRQRVGFFIDEDLALQRAVQLGGHGSGLFWVTVEECTQA